MQRVTNTNYWRHTSSEQRSVLHIDYRLVIAGHETADIQEENATFKVYLALFL